MSFGGGGSIHTEETRALSLRVNQSAYGGAKTRVWGKFRVPGNMLDYMDFAAIPHTTTQSSGGGKGGGGVESSNTSYTYTAGVIYGLSVGPVAGVGKVWLDKDVTDLASLGFTLKTGELRQSAWAHLLANYPDRAVSYSGIAYVANATFDLGASASQPNLNFEVFGERLIAGADDAQPADIIYDIVADPMEGVGLPADVLANLDDYSLWCAEMGLTLSVGAKDQTASREIIARILKATMAEAVWSAGTIKIIPYGDEPVGAWTPNATPVYDLTEADLLEPPRLKRTQPADAVNRVTLNYTSRAKDYNTVTITRDDLSAVTQYGARPETIDLDCITRDEVATVVCEFWRDRGLYIRNSWEIVVDERFCLVEAMDLLTITFGPQYLDRVAVRVVDVTDEGDGRVSMTVEEWPFGLLKPTAIPYQPVSGYIPETNVAPGATNAPVIFEAPNAMTAPNLEIWIAASGGEQWGGANVWVSDDGDSYQQVGTITNPARHGVLTSQLPNGTDPDTTHTLNVDLSVSRAQLLSGTQADADNGNTLCWVDGEMLSYQTATLTGENRYTLTYLRRGRQGTVPAGHSSGAKFVRINDAVYRYVVPRERIGSPVWVKLQAYNKYGRSLEPLDTVTPYQYTISGNKPRAPVSLTATGGLFMVEVAVTLPAQVGLEGYEIWGAPTNNRTQAVNLTYQRKSAPSWKHVGLQPGQTWFYWARSIDSSSNASDWYPASQTGGVQGAPSADASSLLAQLQGKLGMPQLAAELASPIALIPGIATDVALIPGMAEDIIQRALDIDVLTDRVMFERAVTDATIQVNPVTGDIELLATANVTTDIESRLTQVETDLNAAEGSLTNTVATVAEIGADLETAQTQITQLAGEVVTKASTVYVDDAVDAAAGAITVEAANNAQALAEAAIRQALGLDKATDKELAARARIALAEQTLTTQANELGAEATARLALAALLDQTQAALTTETSTRATADDAEAQARQQLAAQVASGDSTNAAAIVAEQQARANAISAEAAARQQLATQLNAADSAIAASVQDEQAARVAADAAEATARQQLAARVTDNETGLTAAQAAIVAEQQARATAISAEATARQQLAAEVAGGDSANAAAIQAEAQTRATAVSAVATANNILQARLDTGDFAAVKQSASASADALGQALARWGVKVQAMADGNIAVAGIELLSGADQESVFAILADRLLVYKPNGTGSPIPLLSLGVVNGQTALVLNGSLIADGAVVARHLSVDSLSAISANLGSVTAAQMDIYSGAGGGWGYMRSYAKWWGDGNNGWILARHSNGNTGFEAKSGPSLIRIAHDDYRIEMPGISMTPWGVTISQLNVIDTLQVKGNAITVPLSATGSNTFSVSTAWADFGGQPVMLSAFIDCGQILGNGNSFTYSVNVDFLVDGVLHYQGSIGTTFGPVFETGFCYAYLSGAQGCVVTPPAGYHYFTVQISGHVAANQITLSAVGMKR